MTHKVAIAISGAVSLGSYESGTLYELINAIKLHNQQNPTEKIEIDVLSGASAGGMTAAMVAQKLLYDAPALEAPESNSLADTWIKGTDIIGLMNMQPDENRAQSLLSSDGVWDSARRAFFQRYQNGQPAIEKHIASANTLHLGLALSNLNGVDYELPTYTNSQSGIEQGEFIQTRNQDRYTVSIDDTCDNEKFWYKVAKCGQASGAFPIAFRPVEIQREWATDDYQGRGAKNWEPGFDGRFTYVDGGMFNNYPLGMARSLAKRVDDTAEQENKRYYFYISPSTKVSSANYQFQGSESTILSAGAQILKSIYNNSGFQDWVQTDDVNGAIERLHQQAIELLDVVTEMNDAEINTALVTFQKMCEKLYAENSRNFENDIAMIEREFAEVLSVLPQPLSNHQKRFWLMLVLIMQSSADLTDKERMHIYTITAKPSELSSSPIAAFLGFFDQRFRERDYLIGRLKARKTINNIIEAVKAGKPGHLPLAIEPLDTSDIQSKIDALSSVENASIETVHPMTREAVSRHMKMSTNAILKSAGVNWLFRWIAVSVITHSVIRKFLKLEK